MKTLVQSNDPCKKFLKSGHINPAVLALGLIDPEASVFRISRKRIEIGRSSSRSSSIHMSPLWKYSFSVEKLFDIFAIWRHMTSSDMTMLSNYGKLPYLSTQTWSRGKSSVNYYVFMGQEHNGGIIISDNTIFFKMAANMAAKSHQNLYLSSQTW